MRITRDDARKALLLKVMEADDKQLEKMLDAVFYGDLYNFLITEDYDEKDEMTYRSRYPR